MRGVASGLCGCGVAGATGGCRAAPDSRPRHAPDSGPRHAPDNGPRHIPNSGH